MGSGAPPPPEMEIQLSVVEDLGIKLYGYLPPVISEIVANAWDADAKKVSVSLPSERSNPDCVIVVRDDGHGMSYGGITRLPSPAKSCSGLPLKRRRASEAAF